MPILKPLKKDLIVHPFEPKEMTSSGLLHVPDRSKRRINQGIVVGKGKEVDQVEIGDHILFNGYTGDKVSLEGGSVFFVVPEDLVIGIIEDSDVKLFDSETLKSELEARRGELAMRFDGEQAQQEFIYAIFDDILDRIDSFTIAKGFEF